MKKNIPFWALVSVVLFLTACSDVLQAKNDAKSATQAPKITLDVYKSRTCRCCQKWVRHIEEHGFEIDVTNVALMSRVKDKHGIEPQYRSCHTALSQDGFVFEGHIPAKYIQQFLENPPEGVLGLSVPAMPIGSPGMEVDERFQPYLVLQLNVDGSVTTFAEVNTYEEQF